MRGADADSAAVATVEAFRAFTDNNEVRVVGGAQWRGNAFVVLRGTKVHVVIESEAELQQQTAFKDTGGNRRVTNSTQKDSVVSPDCFKIFVGQGVAGAVPAVSAQIEVSRFKFQVGTFKDFGQNLQAFGNNLFTDTVAGNNCKLQSCHSPIVGTPMCGHSERPPTGLSALGTTCLTTTLR